MPSTSVAAKHGSSLQCLNRILVHRVSSMDSMRADDLALKTSGSHRCPELKQHSFEFGLNHREKTMLCLVGYVKRMKGRCHRRYGRQIHSVGIYQRDEAQLRMTIGSLLPHGENFGCGVSGFLMFSSHEDTIVLARRFGGTLTLIIRIGSLSRPMERGEGKRVGGLRCGIVSVLVHLIVEIYRVGNISPRPLLASQFRYSW